MVDSKENYKFDLGVKRLNSPRSKAESMSYCWQKTVFNGVMAKFFPIYGYRLKYFHWVYLKFSSGLTFLLQLTAKLLAVLQPTVTPLKPSGNTSPFFVPVLHYVNRRASKYHRVKEEDLVARLSAHLFLQLHVLS